MKKIKNNIIIIGILTFLLLYFVLKDNFNEIINVLFNSDYKYVLLMFLIMLIAEFIKSLALFYITKGIKKDYTIIKAFKLQLETNFFNGITPFALGGQPFQLYIMKRNSNIGYTNGVNILFEDFFCYQLALVILYTLFIVINKIFNLLFIPKLTHKLLIIGGLINIFIIIFLIFLAFSKGRYNKFVDKMIIFLSKLKIVKDKNKTINKINDSICQFKEQVYAMNKNYKVIIRSIVLNIVRFLLFGIIGYLSFKAVDVSGVNVSVCIIAIVFIIVMAAFIPIPGSSGGMEFGFVSLLSIYALDVKLMAAMILWRFVHYYFPMIFGACLFLFEKREKV